MYQSSANLVKDICISNSINAATAYNGPSCNCHSTQSSAIKIKGHQHNPNTSKVDPGVNWNWGTFYSLINNTSTTCGTATGLPATSITSSSATLNWTSVTTATSYNVQYKLTSSSSWTTVTATTNSKAISGLNVSTSYDFKVQAVCNSTGGYSSVSSFTTAALPTSNDDCVNAEEIFPNSTCIQTSGSVAGATTSGLPKAGCDAFSGVPKLLDVWYKFQATSTSHTVKVAPSADFDAVVALYTSCSGGQVGCADNGGGNGAAESFTSTGLTVGTTYYIRVYSYGANIPNTKTFNICIIGSTPPSCGTPSGLAAGTITASGATLNWNNTSGANSYNVQYKQTSSSTWATVPSTTNTITLSGLNASTAYNFKVQAVCSSAGAYSAVSSFTTGSINPSNSTVTIGTATTPYSAHPFGTVYMDERVQYIYQKGELAAAGWDASTPYLKSISFYVSSVSPQAMASFKITMAHTSGTSFTSTSFLSGTNATAVYAGTVNVVQGWNSFTFTTPFAYNGTSNLLMSICWDNNSFTVNSAVYAHSYPTFVALYYRADLTNSGPCAKVTGTQSYFRPNSKLEFSPSISSMPQEPDEISLDVTSTSIDEAAFEIYPNPLNGTVLYGKLSNPENKQLTIKIFDMVGRELISKELSVADGIFSMSFDDEHLKTGVYMVVGLTETSRFTKKLIVKK